MELEALGQIREGVERLLAVDAAGLADGALHDAVVEVSRLGSRLEAAAARLVGAWDARRVWAADGSTSPAAVLARDAGHSKATARQACRRARRLRDMPVTADAFARGAISVDHVEVLCRTNTPEAAALFSEAEALLVEQAGRLGFSDFTRVARYWSQCADDARSEDRALRQHEQRHVSITPTFDGSYELRGSLDAIGGEIVATELDRLQRELFEADWARARAEYGDGARPDHLARTDAQRRADAHVEMARRSAAARPGTRVPRPLITVLVDHDTFTGRVCETARGSVVTPGQVAGLLFDDAHIERVVFGPANRITEVGRRRRFFTGALRRAIEVRDRHCTHPGCDVPAEQCDVDHVTPYDQGGRTTQDNGRLRCPPHNRWAYVNEQRPPPPNGPQVPTAPRSPPRR
ncbi:MAG: DUF222 domain-containing protein [Actinobacteria bacterium]|nr:DUF222 domain-containing protein [Actinomycetota bacterium]